MPKVLISPMSLASGQGPHVALLRDAGFELVYPPKPAQLVESELLAIIPGIDAVIAGSEPYSAKVLAADPALRVIARVGVGYDAVDVAAATAQGIAVTIAPGTNQDAVAEHTFCLMLALVKDLIAQHAGVKSGHWPRRTNLPLRGQTLGIAGLGRIGKAVALRGEAFGMPLIAYDPYPDHEFAKQHNITFLPFERLLAEADFVSLHLPLTPESKQVINKKTLELMKPTAFLINTARGGLVREADLFEALKNQRLAGAGLDVFDEEPPGKHPLFELSNVVLTPHAAGGDTRSLRDMTMAAAEAVVSLYKGEWPTEKVVNPDVKAKFRW